jgi:TolA-binding protein
LIRTISTWLALSLIPVGVAGVASAQEPTAEEPSGRGGVTLARYLEALSAERLIAAETGSVERLRALVVRGEEHYFEQRYDTAALLLYEVVESPRFADFADSEEFAGAELLLAGSLAELGSLRSAARYLEQTLRRGHEDPYFGPAYRRFVDVALESGDIAGALTQLEGIGTESLPDDAANELRYLRGRAAYDGQDDGAAEASFVGITQRSRFYANAQYLRGVMAARQGNLDDAEARFCSIATTSDQTRTTFYVDDRYYRIKDLAWLGLGRVAHEGLRSDDAFYYYFQVPSDSERVAEALFEAAYSMYEGDDFDTSIDLLDQLEARYPASPFVDEAQLLRGYVHLGRCEFEEASQLFVSYQERFGPLLAEIDTVLASEVRQAELYGDLLRAEADALETSSALSADEVAENARNRLSTMAGMLLALLRVDPDFYNLHAQIRTLNAEAARAGRLAADLRGLSARVRQEGPAAAAEEVAFESEIAEVRRMVRTTREMLGGLSRQLDALRRGGAEASDLQPLEVSMTQHAESLRGLVRQLRAAESAHSEGTPAAEGDGVRGLLAIDARAARTLPTRVEAMRVRLTDAAGEAAVRSLRGLRRRLASSLRRARIGRIDAVMGSKRRIEVQIESLAAGRFPPELIDPLRVQGLLRDDEEYWPFEGELWEDEFEQPPTRDDDSDEGGDEADELDDPADLDEPDGDEV